MKRILSSILCGALITGLFGGCGGETGNVGANAAGTAENESAAEETQPKGEAPVIRIWHDGDEAIMETIAEEVNNILADDMVSVQFEKKTGLTDQLQLYGTDEVNGPDMYFYAHDSLGTFAEMGILAPITDLITEKDEGYLLPMTVEAGTYQGIQYMLPVYYETLLFIYNQDLWEGEVPDTTDGLYDYMTAHTDTEAGTYAVLNQHSTAYNVAPFINGFGGYIINENAKPGLNDTATIEAITYNQKFAALQADGDYNTINTLFLEQKAAAIIGGPWLISGINEAGIHYGIKSLSEFTLPNGEKLAPYSGIQGVGVLKYAAENKKDAASKVLLALCDESVGVALAQKANCAPANQQSYADTDVVDNEMIMAMRETAETAQPMPNIPEMSVMWGPAESLLAAVNKSGEDVQTAAETYQKEAETAIADMH